MTPTSYIIGIAAAVATLVVVIELLRRRQLKERHALWWFLAGVMALVVGIFPATLTWAAHIAGVEIALNLVFFVTIAVLFLVCLQHSSELTRLENKTRILAENLALQDLRIRQLERAASAAPQPSPSDSIND